MKNRLTIIILSIALLISLGGNVYLIVNQSALKNQLAEVQQQLTDANNQITALESQLAGYDSMQSQIADLQEQIRQKDEEIETLKKTIEDNNATIEALQNEIIEKDALIADLEAQLSEAAYLAETIPPANNNSGTTGGTGTGGTTGNGGVYGGGNVEDGQELAPGFTWHDGGGELVGDGSGAGLDFQ